MCYLVFVISAAFTGFIVLTLCHVLRERFYDK